jgi:hypothetical protein
LREKRPAGTIPNVPRLIPATLVLAGLSSGVVGCAFESPIEVQFPGTSPVVVQESLKPLQTPHRVHGVTNRRHEVVGINCSTTIVYDVNEATGPAVLVQRLVVRLRTRPLPRGLAYEFDCTGALIVQIPRDASAVQATATSSTGPSVALPAQAPMTSIPIAFGRRLKAQAGTQLAVIRPGPLSAGDYSAVLTFSLPGARTFRERALYAASISCGRARYLQPILPPVSKMAQAPRFRLSPSTSPIEFPVPRIAGANGAYRETTRPLSCVR